MEKTIKEISDELKIDKQRVYRYIKKNHISEAHQKNGVMYYDEVAQKQIKQGFFQNEAHHEAHQNHINDAVVDTLVKQSEMLQKELKVKNEQIERLQKLLDQEQQLRMVTEQKLMLLEDKSDENVTEKKKFNWFGFGKKI